MSPRAPRNPRPWFAPGAGLLFVLVLLVAGGILGHHGARHEARAGDAPAVRHLRLPDGSRSPQVARAKDGALHVVFARKDGAYYARLEPKAAALTEPVRVTPPGTELEGRMERGPRVAVGRGGRLHVVWMGSHESPGVFYARSEDGGKTFAAPRPILDRAADAGVDGPAVAADDEGRLFVVWLDGRLGEDKKSPTSLALFMARSTDDGATFGPNENLLARTDDYPGRACACCALAAEVLPEGRLAVAFRGAYESVRDPHLLVSDKEVRRFKAACVSGDGWRFQGCPMSGIAFAAVPDKPSILAAWMSQGRVYFAAAGKDMKFGARAAAREEGPGSGSGPEQRFPCVATAPGGRALVAWSEGRALRWVLIEKGKPAARGDEDGLPDKSRPVAALDAAGGFVLIY